MESTVPEEEAFEMPDPEEIPETPIDTSAAFSGTVAPIKKDPEEMVQKRAEGKLPYQESETSIAADTVAMPGDEAPATQPPPNAS